MKNPCLYPLGNGFGSIFFSIVGSKLAFARRPNPDQDHTNAHPPPCDRKIMYGLSHTLSSSLKIVSSTKNWTQLRGQGVYLGLEGHDRHLEIRLYHGSTQHWHWTDEINLKISIYYYLHYLSCKVYLTRIRKKSWKDFFLSSRRTQILWGKIQRIRIITQNAISMMMMSVPLSSISCQKVAVIHYGGNVIFFVILIIVPL